ncbi:uncharacterized protein LOC103573795 isoform X1 [Microplitis demolitor]|uniref:uncharacterized protein LOC103573795 isoform X1 n=1 Tax=Microplitis demolitor TaxID=69319 RepID=UPI00235B6EE4|nr:uncharacterized protein LOC103573795 isoform X1 [Microplitis demolitor]
MFPVEIWEIILKKVSDPSALVVLQEVCSTWYYIIEKIIKNFNWKRTCIHEIGRSHVHDIMIKAFPSHCLDDYPVIIDEDIWRGTYYSFSKWIMILNAEPVLMKIDFSENSSVVTCTATSNDNVAIGTNSGSIYFYNIFNVNEPFFVAIHGEPLDQVEFWYNDQQEILAVSKSKNNSLKFWNVSSKAELKSSISSAQSICVGSMYNCYSQNDEIILEHKWSLDGIICNTHLRFDLGDATAIGIYLRNARPLLLSYKNNSELKLFLRQDMAYGLSSKSERVLRTHLIPDDFCLSCKFYVTYYNAILFVIGKYFLIIIIYFFKLPVVFINISEKYLFISFSYDYKIYDIFSYLDGCVTSIITHGHLLFLGLDSGVIHVIHAPTADFLLHLNFNTIKTKSIRISNDEPIISMNIAEAEKDPYIFVATKTKNYLVNFI